jgi:hypothetical protein
LKASLPAAFRRSASLPGLALTCRQSTTMSIQCRGLRHQQNAVCDGNTTSNGPVKLAFGNCSADDMGSSTATCAATTQLRDVLPCGTAVAPQRDPHTRVHVHSYMLQYLCVPPKKQATACGTPTQLLLTNVLSATTRSSGSPPQSTSTAAVSLPCAEEQGAGPWLPKSASRSAASWRSSSLQDDRVDHTARPASMPALSCSTPSCVGRHSTIRGQCKHALQAHGAMMKVQAQANFRRGALWPEA